MALLCRKTSLGVEPKIFRVAKFVADVASLLLGVATNFTALGSLKMVFVALLLNF